MNANELAREIAIAFYDANKNECRGDATYLFTQWSTTPEAKSLIAQLSGVGGMKWVKVKDKTPGQNACFRQWWENTYPNKTTGRIEPKGEWMYFNGKINEYDEVYDDDGGVNPVDQDTVEWLSESPIPSGEQDGGPFIIGDRIDGDDVEVDTLEDVKKYLKENYSDPEEGIHPDIESIKVFKEVASVKVSKVDGKNTYRIEVIPLPPPPKTITP